MKKAVIFLVVLFVLWPGLFFGIMYLYALDMCPTRTITMGAVGMISCFMEGH